MNCYYSQERTKLTDGLDGASHFYPHPPFFLDLSHPRSRHMVCVSLWIYLGHHSTLKETNIKKKNKREGGMERMIRNIGVSWFCMKKRREVLVFKLIPLNSSNVFKGSVWHGVECLPFI